MLGRSAVAPRDPDRRGHRSWGVEPTTPGARHRAAIISSRSGGAAGGAGSARVVTRSVQTLLIWTSLPLIKFRMVSEPPMKMLAVAPAQDQRPDLVPAPVPNRRVRAASAYSRAGGRSGHNPARRPGRHRRWASRRSVPRRSASVKSSPTKIAPRRSAPLSPGILGQDRPRPSGRRAGPHRDSPADSRRFWL